MDQTETMVGEGQQDEAQESDDKRVALAQQDDEAIVRQVLEWWKLGWENSVDKRKLREQCHRMYDGDQWEEGDVNARGKRPTLTFNLMLSIVSAVEGQERNNRQEMKYFGVGLEDETQSANWTKLLKWVMDGNEGDFEMSAAFLEMLKSGEGWVMPEVDTLDDPEGTIKAGS